RRGETVGDQTFHGSFAARPSGERAIRWGGNARSYPIKHFRICELRLRTRRIQRDAVPNRQKQQCNRSINSLEITRCFYWVYILLRVCYRHFGPTRRLARRDEGNFPKCKNFCQASL